MFNQTLNVWRLRGQNVFVVFKNLMWQLCSSRFTIVVVALISFTTLFYMVLTRLPGFSLVVDVVVSLF